MRKRNKKIFSILFLMFITFGALSIDFTRIDPSDHNEAEHSLKSSSSLDYLSRIIDQVQMNNNTVGDQHSPSMCALSNETIVGVWTDNNSITEANIHGAVYDAASMNITSEFQVNQYAGFNAYPSICALSHDLFAVAWYSYSGINVIVFNATSGTNFMAEFCIIEHLYWDSTSPSICALSNDKFAVTWISRDLLSPDNNSIVYTMIFDAITGTNITAEIQVNEYIYGRKYNPLITSLNNDLFVVVWENEVPEGFHSRMFNASTGQNITSELLLNNSNNNEIGTSSICALSDETFLLAWNSYSQEEDDWNLHASVINATNGKNTTEEFRINKYSLSINSPSDLSICALSNDVVAIVWNRGFSTYDVVKLSIINITKGELIVEEFQVNDGLGSDIDLSICTLSNDSFAITWSSYSSYEDGLDLFGSLFGPYNDVPSVEITYPSTTMIYSDRTDLYIGASIYDRSIPGLVSAKVMIEPHSNYEPFNISMYRYYDHWYCIWSNISYYMNTDYHKITIWAIDNVGNINQEEYMYIYILERPYPLDFLKIISWLILIFALIISSTTYILASKRRKKRKNRLSSKTPPPIMQYKTEKSSTKTKCFHCDTLITREAAAFCNYCGSRIKCFQCGTLISSEGEFCNYCGASFKKLEEKDQSELNQSIEAVKLYEEIPKTPLDLKKIAYKGKKTKISSREDKLNEQSIEIAKNDQVKKTLEKTRIDPLNNSKLLEIMKKENALEILNSINIRLLEKDLWEKIKMLALVDDDLNQLLEDILALSPNERKYIINGMLKLKKTNDNDFQLDMRE